MAATNKREIELALSITTANADALSKLQDDVKGLAKEGGDAAPEFQKLADELGKLAAQAKQLNTLETLTAELGRASTAQSEAAATTATLKTRLDELTAAATGAKEAERAKNQELREAKQDIQKSADAIRELKNNTEVADRTTYAYTSQLKLLTQQLLDARTRQRALATETDGLKTSTQAANAEVSKQGKLYNESATATQKAGRATRELQSEIAATTDKYKAAGGAAQTLADAQQGLGTALTQVKSAITANVTEQERLVKAERDLANETLRQSAIIAETKRAQAAQAKAEADAVIADYARIEQAEKEVAASAKTAADGIANAFGTVGTKSAQEIRQEIERVRDAMRTLGTSGGLTGAELTTAMRKGEQAVKRLERELRDVTGTLTLADRAARTFKGALGQIAAGNLVADGVGYLVQKVKDLGRAFVTTTVETETLRRGLNAIYKDSKIAGDQFDFLRTTSNKVGVAIDGIQASFVRFSAAARTANIPIKVSNELFESVTRTASSLGLSADATGGALDALGQIASKGVVSLEELRQQLGDRMPGALGAAAKGLGLTEAELIKLVESGKLAAADFFPAFTKGLQQMQGSTEGLLPTFNRLKNSVVLLGQNMGDSAFGAVFTSTLKLAAAAVGILGGAVSGLVEILGLAGKAVALLLPGVGSLSDRMKIFGDEVDAAAARQSKFSDAINQAINPTQQAAAQAQNLATATNAAAKAAADAGDNWDKMSRSQQAAAIATEIANARQGDSAAVIAGTVAKIEQLLGAQEKESTAREKSAKAATLQGDTLVALAKLQGDEVGILTASVAAAELQAAALEKVAFSRAEEVRLLELQRETIISQRAAQSDYNAETDAAVIALDKKLLVTRADAEQSRAAADASKGAVEASRLQREAYDDNSKAVAAYKEKVSELSVTLAEYGRLNLEGKKTDAEVLEVRKQLAESSEKLRDALQDSAAAAQLEAREKTTLLEVSRLTLSAEVQLLEAKAQQARTSGNLLTATRLEREAKEAKLKIDELGLEIKRVELDLASQELALQLELLKLNEPTNALKRRQLELQIQLNDAQRKGLDAGKELLEIRKRELQLGGDVNRNLKNLTGSFSEASGAANAHATALASVASKYSDVGAAALAAQGQILAAAAAQKSADTSASSITNRPPSASQGVWNRSMIIDYLKQSGLAENLAEDLSKQFVGANGNVDYMASAAQTKWGGKYSTLSEALGKMAEYYKFNDQGKAEASSRQEFLDRAQTPKSARDTTPSPEKPKAASSGNARNVTINLNGRSANIRTDAQGARDLENILSQLDAASGRSR